MRTDARSRDQLGRVGVFVVAPEKTGFAALPHADPWALYHGCFTGYTEAARLASEGRTNIYDPGNYEAGGRSRRIGLLIVDEYEYPPPFLPLPAALSAVTGHDVVRTRALFYGLQAVLVVLVMVAASMRLNPAARLTAWVLMPGVGAAFQTIVGMQYGNFQSGAFALAVAGMLAATRGSRGFGAVGLAFAAVSKLFPGLLVALLIGARRYRAALIAAVWMAIFTLLSLAMFGTRPWVDFVTYQLPAISSGSGFAWSELPFLIPTNYGVSGAVLKAGALGLPGVTYARAMQTASIYGIVVTLLALYAAWRLWRTKAEDASQAGGPMLWLALLNLASFRSPYVADAQATMGTLWLLSLVIASCHLRGARLVLAVAAWIGWALTFEGIAPHERSVPLLIFTLALQLAAIAFNAGVLWIASRAGRRRRMIT
ncbi:MAG: DUF2029 domain-containing protein [Acidobacteriota bacterium]|nr:DUF2029 domain-containing protein [Acidobacteriota bacterium]